MKAMVLSEIGPIESSPLKFQEVPCPRPGPGECLVKVKACGICRTDLHVIEGELKPQKKGIIPGHQVVGEVVELGRSLSEKAIQKRRFSLGERIGIAWLRKTCGTCSYCLAKKENLCEKTLFTGYHENGGYAEYAVVPEQFAYAIPEVFEDVEATPLLCAGIIGYRALRQAKLPAGGDLALFGFGSSAHMVIQLALHRKARVLVITRGQEHRQLAQELGAFWTGTVEEKPPYKVDSAILFAPVGHLVPPALALLKKGGTLALAGIYMTPIPQMDYEECLFYERHLVSVTANTRQDGEELLKEAAQIPLRPQVTLFPLKKANQALLDLKKDRINGSGVLVV